MFTSVKFTRIELQDNEPLPANACFGFDGMYIMEEIPATDPWSAEEVENALPTAKAIPLPSPFPMTLD